MPADNHTHPVAAAQRRSAGTLQRARAALRRLDRTGAPITFAAVADAANVSRSWLYRQRDLRDEIEHLRTAQPQAVRPTVPAAQRASQASLQQRLETVLDTSRALREENQKLRDQVAALLGEQRAAAARRPQLGPPAPAADQQPPCRRHVAHTNTLINGIPLRSAPDNQPTPKSG